METTRNQAFDLYQQIKPREYQPTPVTIVDIDERSINEYGQWPWPRTRMAELVQKINEAGAAATAFDIVFSEEDRLSPANFSKDNPNLADHLKLALKSLPSNDVVFANAIRKSRIVVGQTSVRNEGDNRIVKQEMVDVQHAFLGPDPKKHMVRFFDIVQNRPEFERAAAGRGVFSNKPGIDGVYRTVPLVMLVQDKVRLSLAPELLRVATGGGAFAIKSDAAGVSGVILARQLIKTDSSGKVWPYFTPTRPSRFVSAADILSGNVPPNRLRGQLLLVGTSAIGLEDFRATPMGVQMAGVEIHAQLLENILTKQMLFRPNYAIGIEIVTIAILGLMVIILVPLLGAFWSVTCAVILLGGYVGASYYVFSTERLLVDPVFPVASTFATFIVMATANYIREERQKRQIRGAFGQYVSPALVSQLSDDPERLVLGGETRELSVLFSDVRGFTGISESFKDNPQGLTELMNTFLTTMSDAILDYNGTIDKFMGDAVMAFWNAPLDNKNHEMDSCLASLAMIERVNLLNKTIAEEHASRLKQDPSLDLTLHEINIGIGINSGNCVVGNMGSRNRFDYTALGDTVNVASRLEGQSKPYGIKIVLGSNTAKAVQDELAVIEIDQIRVKGKDEPEQIFGLFGTQELAQDADFKAVKALNRTMLQNYREQNWDQAFESINLLRDIEARLQSGIDEYLFIYETRIAEFSSNPPGENWDGVYTATSK